MTPIRTISERLIFFCETRLTARPRQSQHLSQRHCLLLCRHVHHLPFSPQAEAGELVLKLLERSGLVRTQQGAALMLTVHGIATEMKMDNIANMTCANLADLYTVSNPNASLLCYMHVVIHLSHVYSCQNSSWTCQNLCSEIEGLRELCCCSVGNDVRNYTNLVIKHFSQAGGMLPSRNPMSCRHISGSRHNAFWTWKEMLTAATHH